ncbi:MAG: pseudouridine synthase [Actinomycetes bacterium]|jgi:23S rRNA pseudouridine2605 synthase
MALVRLQKVLADAGVASRRGSEELIAEGRVSVDGVQIRELGSKVDPEIANIEVDGETIHANKSKTYLIFHKPAGVISTMSDPEGRPNLGDYFTARNERLFHVGRLDRESEGLILLTNDGDLAHRATHPSYGLLKKYVLEIEGVFGKEEAKKLEHGIELEDGMARALSVKVIREVSQKHFWVEVSIHEGRYHIVRRMFEALDIKVLRLIRSEFGPLSLGDTKEGRWRALNEVEVMNLYKVLKLNR